MKQFAAILAVLTMPAIALAQTGPLPFTPLQVNTGGAAFTTQALDADKTHDPLYVEGVAYVTFDLAYVYNSATAVTMTCQRSNDSSTWFDMHSVEWATGTGTSVAATWSAAVSANANWTWTVNMLGKKFLRCTFGGTSAAASDTLTVTATASVD